ncbi:MAG: ATPase/histidine kinase/DNA gyrase domain protein, partial [Bacilli bacterium]|nr:ATPase/histidine kinase/DNA gyrase domain protein [Bacilli bacterium]
MKRKIIFLVFLTVFIVIQAWFIYITFNFKYTGVTVEENKNHDWIIKQFDVANAPSVLGLQVGDIINKVNGKNPSDYIFIKKWRNLDQFQSLLVSRNGEQFEVMPPTNTWFWADAFYLTYIGESVSLAFALLLYIKIRSKSAQFLSLVFINIGFVFMSLSASIRGDVLGKVCIDVGVMLLPVVFFHFLIVLLKEKGNLALSHRFLKYLYVPILIILLAQFTYLNTTKVTFYIYQVITLASILYFLIGLLLNFIFLTFCYFKHRKEKTYASTIIKMVWYTLFISFSPIACFSFIPQLLYGHGWIDSPITGWAILLFPISFAYLIATKQLYDIDTIVRRIFLTTLISIVPAAFIVAFISIFLPKEELINRLLLIFAFIVIVISFILYTLEYFIIKFESIMFPRKHHLRTALKKIAKNLGNISSMRELKEIILVDIVQTMEVFGGAVVFKYHNDKEIELIEEGKIDLIGIEQVLAAADSEESDYTVIPINRHEEYTSYLVMTRKKTNTHLNLEEKQWLGLIISYLAVSLENLYLIRRLTLKLHELAAQIPDEKVAQDFVWF